MEILKGYTSTVKFVVPEDLNSATFTVKRAGKSIGAIHNATVSDGIALVTLPYAATEIDGTVVVELQFAYQFSKHTLVKTVDVVTPILDLYEIKEIIDEEDFTDKEAAALESSVRNIITAYTGQTFGMYVGTKVVTGTGAGTLSLPARLISIAAITGHQYPHALNVATDGWSLAPVTYAPPEVRADFDGYNEETAYQSGVPIWAPTLYRNSYFRAGQRYTITDVWGWPTVPEKVKEAARLLVNDYAGDTTYRDRYLVSMTAADWRIQFVNGAFSGTGNVRADQLLAEYVVKYRGDIV